MAPSIVSEDERYHASTQYRLWSFTPTSFLALRTTTNRNAVDRVQDAVRRVRKARVASSADTSETDRGKNNRIMNPVPKKKKDYLTVEEELKFVIHFYWQII